MRQMQAAHCRHACRQSVARASSRRGSTSRQTAAEAMTTTSVRVRQMLAGRCQGASSQRRAKDPSSPRPSQLPTSTLSFTSPSIRSVRRSFFRTSARCLLMSRSKRSRRGFRRRRSAHAVRRCGSSSSAHLRVEQRHLATLPSAFLRGTVAIHPHRVPRPVLAPRRARVVASAAISRNAAHVPTVTSRSSALAPSQWHRVAHGCASERGARSSLAGQYKETTRWLGGEELRSFYIQREGDVSPEYVEHQAVDDGLCGSAEACSLSYGFSVLWL